VRSCTRFCLTAQRKAKTAGARTGFGFHVSQKRGDRDHPADIRSFFAYPWKTLGRGEIRLTGAQDGILSVIGMFHQLTTPTHRSDGQFRESPPPEVRALSRRA
jgi:hypothetical protein